MSQFEMGDACHPAFRPGLEIQLRGRLKKGYTKIEFEIRFAGGSSMRSFFTHLLIHIYRSLRSSPVVAMLMAALLSLAGCQTSRYRAWGKVKPGQTKTSVLEFLGGPDRSIREEGLDRWIYVFYNNDLDNPEWKELQFVHNKVTYIGDRIKPTLTAEQTDEKNEEANREEAERLDKVQRAVDKKLGRISAPAYSPMNDNDDQKINIEAEKRKKAPTFVPVQ